MNVQLTMQTVAGDPKRPHVASCEAQDGPTERMLVRRVGTGMADHLYVFESAASTRRTVRISSHTPSNCTDTAFRPCASASGP